MRTILLVVLALTTSVMAFPPFTFPYGGNGGGGNGDGVQASRARGDPKNPPPGFEVTQSEGDKDRVEKIVEKQTSPPDQDKRQEEDLSELIELLMTLIALGDKDTEKLDTSKLESDDSELHDLIAQVTTLTQLQSSPNQIPIMIAGPLPTVTAGAPPTSVGSKPTQRGRELTPEEKADLKLYQNLISQNNEVIQRLRSLTTPLTKEQKDRIKGLIQWNREYQREVNKITKPARLLHYDSDSSGKVQKHVEQCLRGWRSNSSQGADTRWMSYFWKGGCVKAGEVRGNHISNYLRTQIKAGKLDLEGHTVQISVKSAYYALGASWHSYTIAQIYDKHGNHVGSFEVDTYVVDRIKAHEEVDWTKGKGDIKDDAGKVPQVIK